MSERVVAYAKTIDDLKKDLRVKLFRKLIKEMIARKLIHTTALNKLFSNYFSGF